MMEIDNKDLKKVSRLYYKPGETIIKGGDWGISIYEILEGSVEVYLEEQGKETRLAVLGPGEVIGEMAALSDGKEPRSASVRTREPTFLESWHPSMLSSEYNDMPLIFRRIMDQIVRRITEVNKEISKVETEIRHKETADSEDDVWASKRRYFRKEVDIVCDYRPDNPDIKWTLTGKIKDLSRSGIRLEISKQNELTYSHKPGDKFLVNFVVPPGNRVEVVAKIVRTYATSKANTSVIGMVFEEIPANSEKNIGFFLMT